MGRIILKLKMVNLVKEKNSMPEKNEKELEKMGEETPEEEKLEEGVTKGLSDEVIENVDESKLEKADASYTAQNISVLEGLEAVRKRPGMYIGSTSSTGLHHLVWEIVDNSIDEALAGYCNEITVSINKGETITVKDNGRGIPVDTVGKTGKSGVETVYIILHAGGKFGAGGGYKVSGGLHGVGASVVNALSRYVEVTVNKDGGVYFIRFENGGHPKAPLAKIGTCSKEEHGTTVIFKPDPTIFKETTEFNYETINNRGEEPFKENHYKFDGGIKQYVEFLNKDSTPLTKDIISCDGGQEFDDSGTKELIWVETAMQFRSEEHTS